MTKNYNLADIIKHEGEEQPLFTLKLGKTSYDVPPVPLWPDAVIEALNAEDHITAVRALMGDKTYAAFTAAGGTSALFLKLIKDSQGADLPESSASTDS